MEVIVFFVFFSQMRFDYYLTEFPAETDELTFSLLPVDWSCLFGNHEIFSTQQTCNNLLSLCLNVPGLTLCFSRVSLKKSCNTGYLTDTGQIVFANNSSTPRRLIEKRKLLNRLFFSHHLSAAPSEFKQTASIICSAVVSRSFYLMLI